MLPKGMVVAVSENIELCTVAVSGRVVGVDVGAGLGLHFEQGGVVRLYGEHDQDCCEQVYVDWSAVSDYVGQIVDGGPYTGLTVKGVPDMGLLLVFSCWVHNVRVLGCLHDVKVFVPAYNKQNGFYSDQLALVVEWLGGVERYAVSDYHEDHID